MQQYDAAEYDILKTSTHTMTICMYSPRWYKEKWYRDVYMYIYIYI